VSIEELEACAKAEALFFAGHLCMK
jgi:hypothetical protein